MSPQPVRAPRVDASGAAALEAGRVRRLLTVATHGPRPQRRTTHSPLTGAAIAELPLADPADVRVGVDTARAAQRPWARTSLAERERILLRVHDLVLAEQDMLLDLIQLESGKARRHAFEEVADVAVVARHYARRAATYLASHHRGPGAFPVLSQAVESRLPVGVVGIISPWNYPLSLAISDALPALMAGNAVVLRPDLQASMTALAGVELLRRAGIPEGLVQVVLGDGGVTGQAVVDSCDYVCYTGSTATGRAVGATAARRLVPFTLELGGKNSLYVAADARLDRAVEGAIRGCFSSAGQLCVSHERLLVHTDIYERFVPELVAAVTGMHLSTELAYGADMGSLVSQDQLDRVSAHIADAVDHGATVLAGGRHRPDIGPFVVEPTVLSGVTAAMACRDEETFGPVVALYRVGSDDEAVDLANDTEYGLNAAIYTRDVARGRRLARRIRAGTVNINEPYAAAWGSVGAPMGGMKASGLGRRHGREGILKYTEAQNVTAQYLQGFGPPRGVSDEAFARALTISLSVLKKVGLR